MENQTHPADPSYCVLTLWSEILKIIYLVISTVRQKLKNIRIKLPAAYLLIVCVCEVTASMLFKCFGWDESVEEVPQV